jgi:uncharacterized protein (DUF58 family)
MIPKDILKKIKRMQITTAKKAAEMFAGEYHSVFKGRGLEFVEVREYLPGDEVRSIDWNVTARMGRPFIKKFIEERELTIMFLLDLSRSVFFGSTGCLKRELAAEICAVLAATALKNNDKVGIILFTDQIESYIPPRRGTRHVFKVIKEALYTQPKGTGTDIAKSFEYLNKVLKKSAIIFVVSDFYVKGFKKPLSVANKKHDVVAIQINDPRDFSIPDIGIVQMEDLESGKTYFLDTSNSKVRQKYKQMANAREEKRNKLFYSINMDRIILDTSKPYEDRLINFFNKRKMKRIR